MASLNGFHTARSGASEWLLPFMLSRGIVPALSARAITRRLRAGNEQRQEDAGVDPPMPVCRWTCLLEDADEPI